MPSVKLFAAVAVVLILPLAPFAMSGFTNAADAPQAPVEVVKAVENTRATGWQRGNYWAFHVTFESGRARDLAVVVHEASAEGFRLGSNVSSGFFGLPFNGNVTKELNPEIAGEVWPMFQFPLSDGMRWSYEMLGYEAETVARAAVIDVPGVGPSPGFSFEATSYGQVFARYEYASVVGWLTRFELIEPTTRQTVLLASLSHFGPEYGRGYFVEKQLERVRVEYPVDLPGIVRVRVPDGVEHVRATLVARSSLGFADARLEDQYGRTLVNATAAGAGIATDRATMKGGEARWLLRHAGAGPGVIVLDITGLVEVGADHVARESAARSENAQSTLPVLPQTGHVTSTGWPVAV